MTDAASGDAAYNGRGENGKRPALSKRGYNGPEVKESQYRKSIFLLDIQLWNEYAAEMDEELPVGTNAFRRGRWVRFWSLV